MSDIHEAVKTGNLQRLKELLAQDATILDEVDDGNMAAVDYAMEGGSDVRILEVLLAAGAKSSVCFGPPLLWLLSDWSAKRLEVFAENADLGARYEPKGFTALHTAVDERSPLAVQILLAHGADRSLTDREGRTPLEFAKFVGHTDCALAFTEYAGVASSAFAEVIRAAARLDANSRPILDAPCLRWAVWLNDPEMVEDLLQRGADPNMAFWGSWSPLHAATEKADVGIVQRLLDAGAATDCAGPYENWTPYTWAFLHSNDPVTALLGKVGRLKGELLAHAEVAEALQGIGFTMVQQHKTTQRWEMADGMLYVPMDEELVSRNIINRARSFAAELRAEGYPWDESYLGRGEHHRIV